ncbi:hypothetical protein B0J17DRAFT_668110 [Rhizoctonia solani]|nr:hypothetical protein B0J17DRAFT_668110 [Rhizoctonia solani]
MHCRLGSCRGFRVRVGVSWLWLLVSMLYRCSRLSALHLVHAVVQVVESVVHGGKHLHDLGHFGFWWFRLIWVHFMVKWVVVQAP